MSAPLAPHIAEELWERLGHGVSLAQEPWPAYDPAKVAATAVEVVLQVNGKVRAKITVEVDTPEAELERLAHADEGMRRHLEGKQIVKKIVVRNKLVNLVVR